jgi:DNA-binding CsgD family transcriptional regulator
VIVAATRAIELAEPLGETEILVHALNNLGGAETLRDFPAGVGKLERSLALALDAGLEEHVARAYTNLGTGSVRLRRYGEAERYLSAGLAYCEEHDLDAWLAYMAGWAARLHFDLGRWDEAAEYARAVLSAANVAVASRIEPLIVLGRLRARRGDPGVWEALEEALALARGTGELQRLAPVAVARAEAQCLEGNPAAVAGETEHALAMALAVGDRLALGELYAWRRRSGLNDRADLDGVAEPFASELRGDWPAAARGWDELGCPYEAALARFDIGETGPIEGALAEFQRLGAVPAARLAAQALRQRGVRSIARGPRRSTRENPGQLTARQIEIIGLLREGLTNAEIAERLYITPKTAAHHVSAILGKLGVRSRRQAVAAAAELGLPER